MKRMWILSLILCLCAFAAGSASADEIYAETPLYGADEAQLHNIRLAAQSVDGVCLGFGDEFSFNDIVGERAAEYGFLPAENGRGVEVVGGGVAQVATTVYLALMQRDDIEYSSIYTYNERFVGSYVDSGYDAIATDYAGGIDFAFNSYHEGRMTIYMWLDDDALCCYVAEEASGGVSRPDECDGFAATPIPDSGAQRNNVHLAAMSVDGWLMFPGDEFSFNKAVGPRSERFGYRLAENGRGVEVVGGGVAQVASTIYLALQDLDCIELTEMYTYGDAFVGEYVRGGDEAVLVDYTGELDFAFEYLGDQELTIYVYIEEDHLICEVYED